MVENKKKDALKDLYWAIGLFIFIALEIVAVYFALFGQGGAESETNLFVVFLSLGIGIYGAILLFLLKLAQFITKLTNSEKKMGWMGGIIHDPETSDIPVNKTGFGWLKNPFLVFIISWIVFSIVGVFQVYQNTFFTALPERVPQQITETAETILSTIPQDQEIYIPVALCGLLISIFIWLGKTKKIDEVISKVLIYIVVPIVYVLFWVGNHFFHHGDSDLAMRYVFIFGIICGYLLVIFRSLIPILIFKITGNLYQYLNGAIQADEMILMITIIANVVLIVVTFGIWTAISAFGARKAGE